MFLGYKPDEQLSASQKRLCSVELYWADKNNNRILPTISTASVYAQYKIYFKSIQKFPV